MLLAVILSVIPFFALTELQAIVITEIHYHSGPEDPDEALEFVEIYNEGSVVADISGYLFSTGIQFVFPEETFLAAGDYFVVCRNEDAMRLLHGIDNTVGNFVGRLDNGGETIQLVTPTGSPIAEVDYDDRGLWPAVSDGTGYTLSIRSPLSNPKGPDHWQRSARPGGTPGANESRRVFPSGNPPRLPVETSRTNFTHRRVSKKFAGCIEGSRP